jgi:hypothetical protein
MGADPAQPAVLRVRLHACTLPPSPPPSLPPSPPSPPPSPPPSQPTSPPAAINATLVATESAAEPSIDMQSRAAESSRNIYSITRMAYGGLISFSIAGYLSDGLHMDCSCTDHTPPALPVSHAILSPLRQRVSYSRLHCRSALSSIGARSRVSTDSGVVLSELRDHAALHSDKKTTQP